MQILLVLIVSTLALADSGLDNLEAPHVVATIQIVEFDESKIVAKSPKGETLIIPRAAIAKPIADKTLRTFKISLKDWKDVRNKER